MKPRSNGSYTAATLICVGAGYDGDAVEGAVAGTVVGVVTAVITTGVGVIVGAADEQAVIVKIVINSKNLFIV